MKNEKILSGIHAQLINEDGDMYVELDVDGKNKDRKYILQLLLETVDKVLEIVKEDAEDFCKKLIEHEIKNMFDDFAAEMKKEGIEVDVHFLDTLMNEEDDVDADDEDSTEEDSEIADEVDEDDGCEDFTKGMQLIMKAFEKSKNK